MSSITITFSVDNADTTLVDPHELADYLLDLAGQAVRGASLDCPLCGGCSYYGARKIADALNATRDAR